MRTMFRIVRTNPPTLDDFLSYAEQGVEPMRPLTADEAHRWLGLSVYDSLDRARGQARRRRGQLGWFVSRLELPDDIVIEQTGANTAHHTIWGDPDAFLAAVRHTVDV